MSAPRRSNVLYALAVAVLACSAAFIQHAKHSGWLQLIKKPLPLRVGLEEMDRGCVRPYGVAHSSRLPQEAVEELGTKQYLDWLLQRSDGRPCFREAALLITYYTGVQDQLPHVPEECYYQGAFTQDTNDVLAFDLKELGRGVAVRRLSFYPPRGVGKKRYVYYTICVNGDFYCRRDAVRLRMGDFREKHLYYSKVEIALDGVPATALPEADEVVAGLLDQVLVELVRAHWPTPSAVRGGESVSAG